MAFMGDWRTLPKSRRRRSSIIACALLASVLLGTAAPQSHDPYQIYDRARAVWRTQTYPGDVQYRTTVRVSEGDKVEQEHFNGEASATGGIRVAGVSEEEQAAPHRATGINFKFNVEFSWNRNAGGSTGDLKMDAHRKESSPDYLGVPMLSPEYSFGLGSLDEPAAAPHAEASPKGTLHTIVTVNAYDRAYAITDLGTEALGGFEVHHLRLRPLRDPAKYRLRDLWIDVYTYQVLKLVTQGNFTDAPMNAVPWEVTFQNVGGVMYVDTETAEAPLSFRGDRTFTKAAISFSDIAPANSTLPVLPFMDSGQILKEP